MKKALVIGTGIGAATTVLELNKLGGWEILMVDRSPVLGGGVATRYIGGHPCTLGPRHFLTHDEAIFAYLNDVVPLRRCAEHQFLSYVEDDRAFYNYPIHEDDILRMPDKDKIQSEINNLEEKFRYQQYLLTSGASGVVTTAKNYRDFWLRSVGPTLYRKFIERYTKKMWLVDDESIIDDFTWSPKGVAIKKGDRAGWDTAISAYPKELDGYDPILRLAANLAVVRLGTRNVSIEPGTTKAEIDGVAINFDAIFSTAPSDDLFSNCFGRLNFIGRQVEYVVLPVAFALPSDVYFCYYTGAEGYTRVTEYKKFTSYKSDQTLISIERPDRDRGRYYPMPTSEAQTLHKKYEQLFANRFFTIGRLAKFNYRYDIDDSIAQAIEAVQILA